MKSEAQVKKEIKEYLNDVGAYHIWPVPTGYGPPLLDCYGCLRGHAFAIEVKKEGVWTCTPRQRVTLDRFNKAGGLGFVTNSVERVRTMIGDHLLNEYEPAKDV